MASGDSASNRTTGKNRLILSDKQAAQLDTENVFVYSYGAETVENATKELFAGLRALDEQGATTIFAQGFAETGLGTAYMNRLKKSANQKFLKNKRYL